jgi:hypothetical protein
VEVSATPFAPGSLSAWSYVSSLNTPRVEPAVAVFNGYIYAAGGWDGGGARLSSVEYAPINPDGTLGSWNYTSPIIAGNGSPSLIAFNGYLYAIGGNTGFCTTTVQYALINPNGSLGAWTATSALNIQRTGIGHALASNGFIYVVNGADCFNVQNTVEYAVINANGTLGAWGLTSNTNVNRNGVGAAIFNGYMYAAGATYNLNSVEYAPVNANGTLGGWAYTTSMNTLPTVSGLVAENGYLYASEGGVCEYVPVNANGTLGAWFNTSSLNTARNSYGFVGYLGHIYAVGGGWGGTILGTVEMARIQ